MHTWCVFKVVLLFGCIGCFCCCQGCLEGERIALLQIKDSINHPNGSAFGSWEGENCCEWMGIECSTPKSSVISIKIFGSREEGLGTWYPNYTSFAQFKDLQELDLSQNQIGGRGSLKAFCELKYLQRLDLSYNSIEANIPSCLASMSSLRKLDLSYNQFQGSIPPSIFSNLTLLQEIDISYNQLVGVVSCSMFANLSKLSFLGLSYNQKLVLETESPTWVPSFQLQSLYLANCNINKLSGNVFPSFLSTQYSLAVLDMSHNLLVGSIPSSLIYNSISYLRLRNNTLTGRFPRAYQNMSSPLFELDISINHVHGSIPEDIGVLIPSLRRLNVSSNAIHGEVPSSLGLLSDLDRLDMSNNNLSGEIPNGLTRNWTSLIYFNLSNNTLQGQLLPADANMTQLRFLRLHVNGFSGELPPSLRNSPHLLLLDIRSNYLRGDISRSLPVFPDMGALLLGGNHFEGHIPKQLCQMQKLQFLDLSHNNLSGNVPSCLNNITFWTSESAASRSNFQQTDDIVIDFATKGRVYTYEGVPRSLMFGIDMSSNRLMGNIPSNMGDLKVMLSLNLSNNLLTGNIPMSFKNLSNLESLDLSHNKLTGKIPPQLIELKFLSTFSVAFNDLSGRIPYDSQFYTFDSSSYKGNPGLCGDPLARSCSFSSPPQLESKEKGESSLIQRPLFFYPYVAASYALGFSGVITFLLFNKKWQEKYFRVIDTYMDPWFQSFFKFCERHCWK